MLTPEEFTAAQQALATAETERAALDQTRRDSIDKAREYNEQTRACTSKITAIDKATAPLKSQVAEYVAEQKRQQADAMKAKRAAEEAAKRAAEEAAKAQEKTAIEQKDAEIAALKEQLAAKG